MAMAEIVWNADDWRERRAEQEFSGLTVQQF
jgi:hypothetical protein